MSNAEEIAEQIGYYLPEKGEVTTKGTAMIQSYANRAAETGNRNHRGHAR